MLFVMAALLLAGCATPLGKNGKEAARQELNSTVSAPNAPPSPPAAVQQAVMEAVRAPSPAVAEPRFNLAVNHAKASEVFMGMVTGTPYSMLVHPDVSGTLTLNLKNVTVPEAMEAIRALYGYDYEVQGRRIIVPSPAVQTRIFQLNSLAMQRKGMSDMRVVSGSVSLAGGSGGSTSSGASSASRSLETSSIQTSTESKFWDEVSAALKAIVGEAGSVVVSPQSGVVIVRAAPTQIKLAENFLRTTELIGTRQVMLEAKIIEVQLNDGYQSGINWSTLLGDGKLGVAVNGLKPDSSTIVNPLGTLNSMLTGTVPGNPGSVFGLAFNDGDFGAIINLMKSQGAVHVLSSPRIATLNNQKAILKVGTDDFFVTEITGGTVATPTTPATPPNIVVQPFFSGIALDVTPQIDDKDNVTLHVRPSVSNVKENQKEIRLGDLGNFSLPLASSSISETDSVVRIKDGQIVAIGGLMRQGYDDSKNRLPVLGDIPYLGELFGNTRQSSVKRELVVLIKTTLIRNAGDWGKDMESTQRRFQAYDLPEPTFRP
ncbi:MAG: secretin N-terminal domain-containing protein [Thiobacillus sp.]|nr:secretin N-terminal domain-containing protein [Thiobacillus sp.]